MAEGFLSISVKGLTPALLHNQTWMTVSLEQQVGMALEDSLIRLENTAALTAHGLFKNPTGALNSHFGGQITSWGFPVISGMVFNDSPYAWRRDRGFSGMTDSLGRFYPNDPGVYYMENALTTETDWIAARFKKAVRLALNEFSAGGTP